MLCFVNRGAVFGVFSLSSFGVPLGVSFGVLFTLSTRAFREPDRGVMLEFKKALTGVEISSCATPFGGEPLWGGGPRRNTGVIGDEAAVAILGVKGVLHVLFGGAFKVVSINGREMRLFGCCLSKDIFPCCLMFVDSVDSIITRIERCKV